VRRVSPTSTRRLLPSRRPSRAIHVSSFGRVDKSLYLIERTTDLTLSWCPRVRHAWHAREPDSGRTTNETVRISSNIALMQNAIRPLISEVRCKIAKNLKIKPRGEMTAVSPVRNIIDYVRERTDILIAFDKKCRPETSSRLEKEHSWQRLWNRHLD